ncbi:MAG: hypothetical protein QXP01_01085 [Candidatus Hadarchaeum sp.]
MAQKKDITVKKKNKKLFSIVAPKVFNNQPLGETFGYSADDIKGRIVDVNLMNLTMDIKKQQYKMKFMITSVEGTTAHTHPVEFTMMTSAIKRLVRRKKDKIDDSFTAFTKDNIFLRIKPMLITLNNVSSSLRTNLRKSTRYFLKKYLQEHNYNTFVREVVAGSLQYELQQFLKKLYPLRNAEIRAFSIEKFKQKIKTAEAEVMTQVVGMEETIDPEREKLALEAGQRKSRRGYQGQRQRKESHELTTEALETFK